MTDKCQRCTHFHRSDNDTKVCTLLDCSCDITTFEPEIETKSLDYYQNVIQTFTTIQDKIKYLLTEIPKFRDLNNKQFVFAYWYYNNRFCPGMALDIPTYSQLTDPETIRRCKQKVVENDPTLGASNEISNLKNTKKVAIEEWLTQ